MQVYKEKDIEMIATMLNKDRIETFSKWVDMQIQFKTQACSPEAQDSANRWTQSQDETIVTSFCRGLSWA